MVKKGLSPEQAKKIRRANGLEGTRLENLRVKKGLSQNDLAIVSGVTLRAIRGYEQQTRDIDSAKLETLCNLAIALDCKLEDIIESPQLIAKYRLVK